MIIQVNGLHCCYQRFNRQCSWSYRNDFIGGAIKEFDSVEKYYHEIILFELFLIRITFPSKEDCILIFINSFIIMNWSTYDFMMKNVAISKSKLSFFRFHPETRFGCYIYSIHFFLIRRHFDRNLFDIWIFSCNQSVIQNKTDIRVWNITRNNLAFTSRRNITRGELFLIISSLTISHQFCHSISVSV